MSRSIRLPLPGRGIASCGSARDGYAASFFASFAEEEEAFPADVRYTGLATIVLVGERSAETEAGKGRQLDSSGRLLGKSLRRYGHKRGGQDGRVSIIHVSVRTRGRDRQSNHSERQG